MRRKWMFVSIVTMFIASIPSVGWAQSQAVPEVVRYEWRWPHQLRGQQVNANCLLAYDDSLLLAGTPDHYLWVSWNKGREWWQVGPSAGLDLRLSWVSSLAKTKKGSILLGSDGVYKSTDRADSWRKVADLGGDRINAILVTQNGIIFACGDGLHRSDDDGESWSTVIAINDPLLKNYGWRLLEMSSGVILIGLNSGISNAAEGILRSLDGGNKWERSNTGLTNFNITGLAAYVPSFSRVVYATTDEGGAFISDDDGETWKPVKEIPEKHGGVAYVASALGAFFGFSDDSRRPLLYRSHGVGWQAMDFKGYFILSLAQISTYELAIGTNDGVWVATFDNPTEVEGDEVPTEFVLHQNYPNPFNPTTTIRFSIPKSGHVKLSAFSLLGQEIAVLVDEEKIVGVHEAHFNGSGISSGIYFARLETSTGFTATKKMVLMK